jgi:hypothetical protein
MRLFGLRAVSPKETARREILGYLNVKPDQWRTAQEIADEIGDAGTQTDPAIAALVAAGRLLTRARKTEDGLREFRISIRGVRAVERPFGFRELLPLVTPIAAIFVVFSFSSSSVNIAKQQMTIAATAYREDHQPQLTLTCNREPRHRALASALAIAPDPTAANIAKIVQARHLQSPFVTDAATSQLRCILANHGHGVAQNVRLTFAAHFTQGLESPDIACENVPVPPLSLPQTPGRPGPAAAISGPFDIPAGQNVMFVLYNRTPAWLRYEAPSHAVAMRDGQFVELGLSTEGGGYLSPAPAMSLPAFDMPAWLAKQVKAEKNAPVRDCRPPLTVK